MRRLLSIGEICPMPAPRYPHMRNTVHGMLEALDV